MRDVGGRSDETIITGGQRDSGASICKTVGMGKICRAGAPAQAILTGVTSGDRALRGTALVP